MPTLIVFIILFLIVYIPDPQAVVAQLFLGDYFHVWDVVFMGTVYGLFSGLIPCVDVNATYGLGMPIFIAQLMKCLGTFDYAHALIVLMGGGFIYFCCWYMLTRTTLKSSWVSFAALLIALRVQMFNPIVMPLVWNEAQASVWRFIFDVFFFLCLQAYERHAKQRYFWGMVLFAAVSFYHMPTTGIFLCAALFFYALMFNLRRYLHDKSFSFESVLLWSRPLLALPALIFIFYYLTVGQHLWTKIFWANVFEWSSYFARGFFYTPMLDPIHRGEYAMVALGVLIPVLYLGTFLLVGWRYLTAQRLRSDALIWMMAFYGLGLYTYYVGMSHKYWPVILPAVFILFYWIDWAMGRLKGFPASALQLGVVGVGVILLVSSTMFRAYPNLLNISRNPIVDSRVNVKVSGNRPYFHQLSVDFPEWLKLPVNSLGQMDEALRKEDYFINHDALKSYFRAETAFEADVALIQSLIPEDQRVPLISSFEVMMLSKAERKPFFYYFPLLDSHPLRLRNFVVTTIFSYSQVDRVLTQLAAERPPYIFMERIFLTEQVPQWYGQQFEDLIGIIRYVRATYEPYQVGEFLVAMKRKTDA